MLQRRQLPTGGHHDAAVSRKYLRKLRHSARGPSAFPKVTPLRGGRGRTQIQVCPSQRRLPPPAWPLPAQPSSSSSSSSCLREETARPPADIPFSLLPLSHTRGTSSRLRPPGSTLWLLLPLPASVSSSVKQVQCQRRPEDGQCANHSSDGGAVGHGSHQAPRTTQPAVLPPPGQTTGAAWGPRGPEAYWPLVTNWVPHTVSWLDEGLCDGAGGFRAPQEGLLPGRRGPWVRK